MTTFASAESSWDVARAGVAGPTRSRRTATLVVLAVGLLYGAGAARAEGLTAAASRFLHEGAPDVGGTVAADDAFGVALAAGDFDGNGWDDVAIGIPGKDFPDFGLVDVGEVLLVYHDGSGVLRTERWSAPDAVPLFFGHSAAAGDFNGDGIDDLAVGAYPTEDCTNCVGVTEMIYLFPGTSEGLDIFGFWRLDGSQQFFSVGFVAGDFYGNGSDALATRSVDGLATLTISWWPSPFFSFLPEDEATLPGGTASLAAGDVDGNGADELAVGTPFASVSGVAGAGSVTVYVRRLVFGTFEFVPETWHQNTPGIIGGAELNDYFGFSVAFGDADGDGYEDLFAGVPGEDAAFVDMGAFQRIPGSASGLTEVGDNLYGAGLAEETGAEAARTIVTGNFDGTDTGVEVAVGVRFDDVGGVADAGSVWVGFSGATNRYWHQDVPGIADSAEADDHFGGIGDLAGFFFPGAMTVGDFNADGADDLAIGIPDEDLGGASGAGAVQILFGTPPNGCTAVPDPACVEGFVTAKLQVKEKTLGKEVMTAKWLNGPAVTGPGLGNPIEAAGTTYTVCLYGDGALVGSYIVDRAGDTCGTNPCWKSIGGDPPENKGYKYTDKVANADGIQKIQLKAGDAGKSKLIVKGKNNAAKGQTSLPTGVAAALAGSTTATMQLFGNDVADCFSATLTDIQKDDGLQFKARN